MATTKTLAVDYNYKWAQSKKKSIFSGSTFQQSPRRPTLWDNKKRRRRGQETLLSLSLDNHRWNRKKHLWVWLPRKASVVSDQSDRTNDQIHKQKQKTRNNQHDWTIWRAARYHISAQLGHVHNMVQQVCFRMATSTSGKTTKSRNVQKTCTSYSDQTRRWETRATWGYTRTRTHLHGDRSGTTSPMGFGGTPTVYQDWSYTDKLHLIMRLKQSPTQYNIVVLWPPAEISVLVTWTKRTK